MPDLPEQPSLSEQQGGEALFTETRGEVRYDAVTADATLEHLEDPAEREEKKLPTAFWFAVGWLVVLILLAVLAPVLPFVQDPNETANAPIEAPPSADHWFGGDEIGRDVFARVAHGARVSLFIGVAAVAFGFVIGGTLGITAGYFGGRYERFVIGAMDTMLAFPALVLALALVTFLSEPGTQNASIRTVTLTLTILAVPSLARITRASTLTFAQREFVTAARSLGARDIRVLFREILPNVLPPMASFALISIAVVIIAEGTLSFLGLSVSAPTATWGNLINEGRASLEDAPWIALLPCAVMFLTLLSFNYAGDQLRAYFDVKEQAL